MSKLHLFTKVDDSSQDLKILLPQVVEGINFENFLLPGSTLSQMYEGVSFKNKANLIYYSQTMAKIRNYEARKTDSKYTLTILENSVEL